MKRLLTTLLLIGIIINTSCQKDDFEYETPTQSEQLEQLPVEPDFGSSVNANFIGKVVDEDGLQLSNVQITIGNTTTITDHNGIFVLNDANVFEKFAYVKAYKSGYIRGSRALTPVTDQVNDVQITLIKERVVATINANEESVVSLDNGSQVRFGGDFIDSSGNPYSGSINVVAHYLKPNTEDTFLQMPGSLLAQDDTYAMRNLETYGMLSVTLYSSSGEELNIAESTPAELEFPVDATQTGYAPERIPLWYFDEEVGIWKEDGFADRVGDKYIGDVTHFTWWNCDMDIDYITACITVETDGKSLTNHYIELVRTQTGQIIYSGYTNAEGKECGNLPKDEQVTIKVYGQNSCSDAIVAEKLVGPFSSDTSFAVEVTDHNSIYSTTIKGAAVDCSGEPVRNGYVYLSNNSTSAIVSLVDGEIAYDFTFCDGEKLNAVVFDSSTSQYSDPVEINLIEGETLVNVLGTCNTVGGHYSGVLQLETQTQVDMAGLYGYTSADYVVVVTTGDDPVRNLHGLNSLTAIYGHLKIYNNDELTSLRGVGNLNECGTLLIKSNNSLTSLVGIGNVGDIDLCGIVQNNSLTSLRGLEGVQGAGALLVYNNPELTTLRGLDNLTIVHQDVTISENGNLNNLKGFENLTTIVRNLSILNNDNLTSLAELSNLSTLGSHLKINENDGLQSLTGLEGINSISGGIQLFRNSSLTTLDGLNNITSTGSNYLIEIGRNTVNASLPNENLTDFCALRDLFLSGQHGDVLIGNNQYNPSVQDITSENCSM